MKSKNFMLKICHMFRFVFLVFFYFISAPICLLILRPKHIWLISEVNFDARDNGFAFFKFLRTEHSEINVYYLIDENNVYFKGVHKLGKTIKPNSLTHFFYFIGSEFKLSTKVHGCEPGGLNRLFLKIKPFGKNIGLKHGIFKNLHPNYFKENAHFDLVIAGAKPEYEFIKKSFHYKDEEVAYTGLARFDNLKNNLSEIKEIFIMPTWRRWLNDEVEKMGFKNTNYFKKWIELLNSSLVNDFVKNGGKINFYVHPVLNNFINDFNCKNINFLSSVEGNEIQSHLNSCDLLITDYSSVFFDVAYLKKPVIFYQFDEEKYFSNHYQKAYFDYRLDGFGPVCINNGEMEEQIKNTIRNNFKMQEVYLERSEKFFTICDNRNCERIYDAIKGLKKCKR